jgi:hypothetical protein
MRARIAVAVLAIAVARLPSARAFSAPAPPPVAPAAPTAPPQFGLSLAPKPYLRRVLARRTRADEVDGLLDELSALRRARGRGDGELVWRTTIDALLGEV